MNEFFRYITPITYGLIVAIWLYVFFFYIKKIKQNKKQDHLFKLLLFILIIDAFRTIFEGMFFGIRHASYEGFISAEIYDMLKKPEYVFLPKFITLITGILVLIIVLYKWIPAEIKKHIMLKELINKKNAELLLKNRELMKAKEKAEESEKLKTEFLNNISHEIRTPMNGIIGFSEILTSPDINPSERKRYSKILQSSSKQLLHIIDDILEISDLETKQEKLNESAFCLNEFLTELYAIFNLKTDKSKITFSLKKAPDDCKSKIISDKTKLHKILSNLLENAFRYTDSGTIELGCNISGDSLIIYVKDTGIGISSENHQTVFQRFSQEEPEISRKYGGLGLGLSIAKENANLLGGDITLESEKAKGSCFFVTIPYKPANQ